MLKKFRGALIFVVCVAVLLTLISFLDDGPQSFAHKYEGADLVREDNGLSRGNTYESYLRKHADKAQGDAEYAIDVFAFEGEAEARTDDEGVKAVYTADGSSVTWKVQVEKAGMYNILVDYKSVESRGVDMERELMINGVLPFSGAEKLTFNRLWTDAGPIRQDNQGNDIRPSQIEVFKWQSLRLKDDMGYEIDPYKFYFDAGESTVTFRAVNEPMLISSIRLVPVSEVKTYEEYISEMPEAQMSEEAKNTTVAIQGEDAYLRSAPSLYARSDRASSDTVPYSVDKMILNYIGGDPWRTAGQWIEWQFEVPEDGYYSVSVKARQSYQRGAVSARCLYIDGEIPFREAETIDFAYNTSWEILTISDENGTPYKFYLTAGETHTIRLEATLGEMGTILGQMEESVYTLNNIYRELLVLTGVNPDRFRDYNLAKLKPEVLENMDKESKILYKLIDDTVAITGQKNDRVATMQTLADQLERFTENNDRITKQFTNFKDNITSLGTSMQNMAETKLDIDMIFISGEEADLPEVHDGFLAKAAHEIRACATSYFVDYNSLGNKYDDDDEDVIEVWIVTGRDQSTVLKTMIDDTFTQDTGIKVNVKLVIADTLLTAVVAGNGPDVVLSLGSWFPVNYAMRNAVEDLTQFEDFDEVIAPFYESAVLPAAYNGGIYALPETQEFSVLFYRKDVLEELNLTPPDTWDDLIALLPTIQGNNMSVGISYPDIATVDLSILNSLIYQNGGQIYDEEGKKTLIDNESGVTAFKLYTSLYNDYGLPTVFDFVSRFRSGEMPIGIANYSTYNTLVVSAPEIRNLWDFTLFPGTVRTDENGNTYIDRSVHAQGLSCMMIATDDEKVKENAWTFMKWWVGTDAQVRFGREIESILGSSARYTTANREALKQLAWSSEQLKVLEKQMESTVGFREIAGGYSTTRHMTNAIRRVINTKEDARETLITYARTINEEIRIKRKEFGLPLE